MGAYNTLNVNLKCADCHCDFKGNLQFKIGELWQYEYKIGDEVKVNFADKNIVGKELVAYGMLEDEKCPYCGHRNLEEYDIHVTNCKIVGFDKMEDISLFLAGNEGRYFVKHN